MQGSQARGSKARHWRRTGLALACALAGLPAWAQAAPRPCRNCSSASEALERRLGATPQAEAATGEGLADLDQRLRVIERKLEIQDEERVAKAKETPVVAVNDKGVSFKSADGAY